MTTYEIKEALRKIAQEHHKKHANKLLRAICQCGAPNGGPRGSEGCRRFGIAESMIIAFEAEISRYNDGVSSECTCHKSDIPLCSMHPQEETEVKDDSK